MSDEEEPAVELGERTPVEGAPLARVSERLMWGIEASTVVDREGETVIRTPDGPQELAAVVESVDDTYFATRQEFERAVRDVIGRGPTPTEETTEDAAEDTVEDT